MVWTGVLPLKTAVRFLKHTGLSLSSCSAPSQLPMLGRAVHPTTGYLGRPIYLLDGPRQQAAKVRPPQIGL
jgi:hypothetical protein